ncbi:hypothetical protein EX895_002627 [Sporisorium graminicola]|uniref:Acyl-CoA thioesterase-like N-terminal HotDog domain-containing protein n=1 Tax=Sporisorium graminicola TaxID=280036 RepID=A0A4U7KUF9_9BASI|nr:hypothetical protein EX895_002627 [Sporisorium graminicola]TKY88275.1 hypothetical protein EX895_002627 [Sporisorium graminicola]
MQVDSKLEPATAQTTPQAAQEHASPDHIHSFDKATNVKRLESAPESLAAIASAKPTDSTAWYQVNILPEWSTTSQMPHGGFLASLLLAALLQHQSTSQHPDPYTLTYDFVKVLSPGEAFIAVTNLQKLSGNFTSVVADLYQSRKGKALQGVSVRGTFADRSKQTGPTVAPLHYGPITRLEDTPVPHPVSWYLPPDQLLITRNADMLTQLETQRRPFTDYYLRFHPDDIDTPQQEDFSEDHATRPAPSDNYYCKGSRILPLRSSNARRIDIKSIPMFGDYRRPAYENVIKKDATHPRDVPTRKWAFPTLQYTVRFLAKIPEDTEWVSVQCRETILDGRIVSDVLMSTEKERLPIAVCQIDSIMFDMRWYLASLAPRAKPPQSAEPSQL